MKLTILHFNDLHGRLEQLPRLMTLIQRERARAAQAGRQVLLLDGGDSSDRSRWESDVTKGRANYSLLEAMGVQATVIGNGEALHWGRSALAKLVQSVVFPVLAGNLVDLADPSQPAVPGLRATWLIELEGFKLGVVGVTQVYPWHYERFGFKSEHPASVIRQGIDELKAQGARQILLLSHLGLPWPLETKAEWPSPNDYTDDEVARDFPEIGLIVGAHSHVSTPEPLVMGPGPTVIVQAGDYGKWLGVLEVDLDDATGAVTAHAGRLIACGADVPPEPTIQGTLELVTEEADRLMAAVVGHVRVEPPVLANRVADVLRDVAQADLAILFSGVVSGGLKAGPITRRNLYEALPGATHVTAAVVAGAQIRRMVERMLASPYRTQSINPRRNAPPLGDPAHSANVELVYDAAGAHVTALRVNGEPLDDARAYRLVSTYFSLNDNRADPEYDYLTVRPDQRLELVGGEAVLWEVVEGWIKQHGGL